MVQKQECVVLTTSSDHLGETCNAMMVMGFTLHTVVPLPGTALLTAILVRTIEPPQHIA